jgi:serine/threonine protein kinase
MCPVETSGKLATPGAPRAPRRIGRYALFGEIASGGMATVHFGRLVGAVGFSRAVAVKQLHPQYARSTQFVAQFLEEAQLTARIRHPNVVSVLDVVARRGELFVIMEFIDGETLSRLVAAGPPVPVAICSAIMSQVLLGLHAAHEAKTERGAALEIVHRDVSPQNVLVGVDGVAHILDFGIAKAASRVQTTESNKLKGKLSYMAPEQLHSAPLDRRVDVFAAGVVLWELLTGRRLFARSDPGATVAAVLACEVAPPSQLRAEISKELDAVVLKALALAVEDRFSTAREMAVALESCTAPASSLKVSEWVENTAGDTLRARTRRLRGSEENTPVGVDAVDADTLQQRLAQIRASMPSIDLSGVPSPSTVDDPVTVTLSLRAPELAPQRGLRARFVRGGVLGIALLGSMAAFAAFQLEKRPAPGSALASRAAATLTEPRSTTLPAAKASAAPSPSVLVPSDLPLEATGTAPAKQAVPVHPRKTPRRLTHATPKCRVPFTLDSSGHKRFDPNCF